MMTSKQFQRRLVDIEQGDERLALEALDAFVQDVAEPASESKATQIRERAGILRQAMGHFWDQFEEHA